jgi:hypothetical protein
MNIHTRIRTLAAAALLALTVVSMSAGQADAKPRRPADNGVRCASYDPTTGEWDFLLPGETITIGSITLRCGADGKWHPARYATPGDVRPVEPLSGGVLAP